MTPDFLMSFIFGLFVLIVNAYNLFYSPTLTQAVGVNNYPILNGVGVDRLSSSRSQTQGLLLYVVIYVCVYVAALMLWQLGEVINEMGRSSGLDGESGPQTGVPTLSDYDGALSGHGDGRPLIVAMSMIAIMSSTTETGRYLRVLEGWVRQVAHRLAGIPHGIYRLITRLNAIDFRKAAAQDDTDFDVFLADIRKRAEADTVFIGNFQKLEADLQVIEVLRPAVLGTMDVFPVHTSETLKPLIDAQNDKWDAPLRKELATSASKTDPLERAELESLARKAEICAKNHKALFAVMYRQTQSRHIAKCHKPTNFVLQELNSPDKYRLKDNAIIAITVSFFIFVIAYPLADAFYHSMGSEGDEMMSSFQEKELYERTVAFLLKCVALFSTTWVMTVSIRRAMIDGSDYWKAYPLPMLPFSSLLAAAFWPAVASALVVTCTMIAFDVSLSWDNQDWELFSFIVVFQALDLPVNFFLALVLSIAVFVISDQHIRLAAWKTCILGVVFVFPLFLLALMGRLMRQVSEAATGTGTVDAAVRLSKAFFDVASLALFAFVCLLLFALLVEAAERTGRAPDDAAAPGVPQ